MRRKELVAATFAAALVAAVLEPAPVFVVLLAGCALLVSLGYRYRQPFASFAAGWMLYYPLANLLSLVVGGIVGYLSAGVLCVVLAERLSFDSDISKVMEAPHGVDAEAERLAEGLRKVHGRTLGWYALLCAAVVAASVPAAGALTLAPVLVTAAVLLMFVAYAYVRR